MTGTSIDALDVALVAVEGRGLGMRLTLVRGMTEALGEMASRLRAMADQTPMSAGAIAGLALEFGELHARVIGDLLRAAGERCVPDLIAVHGQTVFHVPPVSWQMVNPWPIVRAIGAPVVCDLRGADLAAGGQGAPITPLFDWLTLRDARETVCVVNLGGFCNVTVLPAGEGVDGVRGFDVCVCNQLLDLIAREELGVEYDEGGARAMGAALNVAARGALVEQLRHGGGGRRSLGTGDERTGWMGTWRGRVSGAELARAAAEGIGMVIGGVCAEHGATRVLLAGGGAKHGALTCAIADATGRAVHSTSEWGVPAEYREAMAIAALGVLSADGVAITLEGVTGRNEAVARAGSWVYPSGGRNGM